MKRLIYTVIVIGLLISLGCTNNLDNDGQCSGSSCGPRANANEGEMCGGIAGIMCSVGLNCYYSGDYPDASGICVNESDIRTPETGNCPMLTPPAPGFCPDGNITPKYDSNGLCITGYECN